MTNTTRPAEEEGGNGQDAVVTYIQRFGGFCRDCADENGVCPNSGLPCAGSDKAIRHVLKALEYGTEHGYLPATPGAAAAAAEPIPEPFFGQFISDVHTAAGLVEHGRRCKPLAVRLSEGCMRLLALRQGGSQALTAQAPVHLSFCASTDDTVPGHPRCTCAAEAAAAAPSQDEVDNRAISVHDLLALLPGPYYMDLPDGGDTTILEQLQRMSEDAARYRQLRRGQKWSVIDGVGDTLQGDELEKRVDAARAAQAQEK